MGTIKIDMSKTGQFVEKKTIERLALKADEANRLLHTGEGAGSDFLGWVNLPSSIDKKQLAEIHRVADSLRDRTEVVVVIGIGGSYLGSKAVLHALGNNFPELVNDTSNPKIVFAGQNLSEDYMSELMEALTDYSIAAIVISKSGTTTEPAVAFRIIKEEIEKRYGKKEASRRIVAVTDKARGALRKLATDEGYETFVIPDDVGGRYSVLTPVGLLPMAVAGVNIEEFARGAADMERATAADIAYKDNIASQYAVIRNGLYGKGYKIEILASYDPKLLYVAEWWKQLYGESEGKDGKGIFPASVTLTADLHSMGQYIQQGERTLFETVIGVKKQVGKVVIEAEKEDLDGLNYLAGKRIGEVNGMAELGVTIAHVDGGVPNIRIEIPAVNAYYIGALLYFFEKACGISGYLLGVNPFDQPGVEAYKKNMFALLEKPGYEKESAEIKKKL